MYTTRVHVYVRRAGLERPVQLIARDLGGKFVAGEVGLIYGFMDLCVHKCIWMCMDV